MILGYAIGGLGSCPLVGTQASVLGQGVRGAQIDQDWKVGQAVADEADLVVLCAYRKERGFAVIRK